MIARPPRGLFEVFGVELEYMIVDSQSLGVRAIADEVLKNAAGSYVSEVEVGPLSWSNELALHVLELKTTDPSAALEPLSEQFQAHVARINGILGDLGARLMPTAMHPWMDPLMEMRLWPHEYSPVYQAYDRIFDCRGHGWANLQSVHLNLPFANDEEFGRLHAAIRLVLPILPALAASSPAADCRITGLADTRLEVYRTNAKLIPFITGQVIPEPVYTEADYRRTILETMYAEIAPLDPEGTLQFEWLNSRGAIARFDRHAIEIRVIDVQECPAADLAVCAATVALLKALVEQRWSKTAEQMACPTELLAALFSRCIRDGEAAAVSEPAYLRLFGLSDLGELTAGEMWSRLAAQLGLLAGGWAKSLELLFERGTLSRRISRSLGPNPDRQQFTAVYGQLCDCLAQGTMFPGSC